ncbi:MAG: EAL domain-containing protein [Peptococcaceae bacterium]|nr:EAL domain-containing protein [Peptococcaceae bacterium]
MSFTITMETVSLLITVLLFLFHFDLQNRNKQYYLFSACLAASAVSISMDILTALILNGSIEITYSLNYALNMICFFVQHLSFSLMVIYCFYLMFEHIADKHCYNIATRIVQLFCIVLELMLLTNPWTDWFFYFENAQNTLYMRGPFNKLAYLFLLVEICMICACYYRNRTVVSRAMRKLIRVAPPMVLALASMQLMFEDTLLSGTMESLVNLLFYISFQNNRVGLDSLTELPNRNTFIQELAVKTKKETRLHLILLHLTEMENINQKYGTYQGDTLLYQVSRYLDQILPHYQAFRFGNTRFLLMGSVQKEDAAHAYMDEILKRFQKPWDAVEKDCYCPVHCAHMFTVPVPDDENRIIDQLEYTLSQIGDKPFSHTVFFDDALQRQYERRTYVLNQIQHALDTESFQLYFQPIYHCRKQKFTSAETLLRLFDENGTPISPAEFIPLAEQNGYIDAISWQLLEKVSTFLSRHPDLPLQTVSINMAMQQITDRTFWNRIHGAQEAYGFSLDKLRIEITERTVSENPVLVHKIMNYLAEKGLRFYLDDFGIGYSNLYNMMNLPFETVKLDASLLQDIAENETRYRVMEPLIQMLHQAGAMVVAEGLETIQQVEKAHRLDVDCIQGYYYAKPMPEEELINFLQNNK